MFASNVAPKRRVREQTKVGWCHSCNIEVHRYYVKCPQCRGHLVR